MMRSPGRTSGSADRPSHNSVSVGTLRSRCSRASLLRAHFDMALGGVAVGSAVLTGAAGKMGSLAPMRAKSRCPCASWRLGYAQPQTDAKPGSI